MKFLIFMLPLFILGNLVAYQAPPKAVPAPLQGIEIMRRVNARSRGLGSRMHLEMTLHDLKRGDFHKSILLERTRLSAGYRTAYRVDAPDHEKGIGLLISEDARHPGLWMYFPATRQVMNVSSRGFPALASDFSCEDLLTAIPLADYDFRVLGREFLDGISTWKVEMTPHDERLRSELGFSKSVGWVRDDIWVIVRADYLDENGKVFKTFRAGDLEQVQGIWTVRSFSMHSNRAQHSTQVRVTDVAYSRPLPEAAFRPEKLGAGPTAE
jgi:Outer membrane lipoprotein-sorting protein